MKNTSDKRSYTKGTRYSVCLVKDMILNEKNSNELDGYHFSRFQKNFIRREKLPSGSSAFQTVLKDISVEDQSVGFRMPRYAQPVKPDRTKTTQLNVAHLDTGKSNLSVKQEPTAKVRRKSAPAFMPRETSRPSTVSIVTRRVHWGEPSVSVCSLEVRPLTHGRPRFLSDNSLNDIKGILKKTA